MKIAQVLPTHALTEQIRAIRDYAKEHDAQKVLIRAELLAAYEALQRPGTVVHVSFGRRADAGEGRPR